MVEETIFQNWIFKEYILPFLLIFALVFAALEKTKLFGEDKKQLNAIIGFVIGLIFVGFLYPKEIVSNMILFLTVSLVIIFVFLLLYGFITSSKEGFQVETWMKWVFGILIGVAVIIALVWATGTNIGMFDLLFRQDWSKTFWTNVAFVAVVVIALALVLKTSKEK